MVREKLKALLNKLYKGYTNILFIGETHGDKKVAEEILNIIRKYKPEIILLEGLNKTSIEEGEKIKELYQAVTLEELTEKIGRKYNVEAKTLLGKYFGDYLKNYDPEKYKSKAFPDENIPKSKEEIINTPLYELPLEIVSDILHSIYDVKNDEHQEITRELAEKIFFFEKIILRKLIYPQIYYYSKLFRTSYEIGAKIAGCDPSEKKENIIKKAKGAEEIRSYLKNERLKEDEVKIAERIYKIIESYKPKKVAVIVGAKHLRDGSELLKQMKKRNLNYEINIPEAKEDMLISSFMHLTYLFSNNENFYKIIEEIFSYKLHK